MQAGLDQNYLFACWNAVWYGVGCVSGPFSGMLFGDIESFPAGEGKYVQRNE